MTRWAPQADMDLEIAARQPCFVGPLPMDPRRSPERVGKADVTDQFADVRRQLRTAARRSRLPSPVKAKTRAVPADYSFWLNNRQGAQHVRCQTIQSGEYQPIELAECRPLRRFTSQDVQLMAQHQDLCLPRDPRLEKPDQRTPDQSAELDHQAGDSPDSPPPANRIRFPTGTALSFSRLSARMHLAECL